MRNISRWLKKITARRLPVILQMNIMECGAACLAMILNFYGRKVSLSECRDQMGNDRDGTNALTIAQVGRKFGLRVKAFSLEPADLKYVTFPAIAHWEFQHFVVIEHWSPQHVDIINPAIGRVRLTADEFDAKFTGVLLTFEPDVQFKRGRASHGHPLLRYFLDYFKQARGLLAQILLASLLLQLFGLLLPIFTEIIVDQVLPFKIIDLMMALGLGIVILVAAQALMTYLRAILLIYLQSRLDSQMMLGFFEHLLKLPFPFFQDRNSGDLLMRLTSNTAIREELTSQTLSMILDSGFVLVYLTFLLLREPIFGLLVMGMGVFQVSLVLATNGIVYRLTQRRLATESASQSYLVEALAGIVTLKVAGAEERALDHWSNLFFASLNVSLQSNHLSALIDTAMSAFRTLSPLLLLWVGTERVLAGAMTLGTMLALNALASFILAPLMSLVSSGQRLQLVGAQIERLADVLEAEPEQNVEQVQVAPTLTGQIALKNVSFRYTANGPLILNQVSLNVEPGKKIALVGRTGSGKSTLGKLLLGLYVPQVGEILYNGIPLPRLNYRTLRRQMGVVLQESFIFSGSIRDNIAFNDPSLSLQQIIDAATLAAIHEDILQMPMGYDTLISEQGRQLSGGQRQRLAIARALAHQPTILLLDEATSHLDSATEHIIEQNLNALSCTQIIIAHRLSTIRNADEILVLDQGKIVERGTHDSLLCQNNYYAMLVGYQDSLAV